MTVSVTKASSYFYVTFILIRQINPDISLKWTLLTVGELYNLTYAYEWEKSIGLRWASKQQASSNVDRQAVPF